MSTENVLKNNFPELAAAGFDLNSLAEMMEIRYVGEFSIFVAAAGLFLDGYEAQLKDIKAAIDAMDTKKIYATAHKFKGAAANFHDAKLPETARAIEVNSAAWTQEQFLSQYQLLVEQTQKFVPELQQLSASFAKNLQEAA